MKQLIQFLMILILSSSVVLSQGTKNNNPFPKFVPYQKNQTKQNVSNEKIDIKELGKEQPARWLSVDPLADKYPGWSPYNYSLNNPLNMVDPDGRDAIPIVFKDYRIDVNGIRVPYLGHAGVLLIDNKTGYTRYYEYGRYDSEGKGIVRNYAIPNVVMNSETGRPTQSSLDNVLSKISSVSGKDGAISGAYIENDNFKEMNDYAIGKFNENNNPERNAYKILTNNCATFVDDVLDAGGVDTPTMVIPTPNIYIDQLRADLPNIDWKP